MSPSDWPASWSGQEPSPALGSYPRSIFYSVTLDEGIPCFERQLLVWRRGVDYGVDSGDATQGDQHLGPAHVPYVHCVSFDVECQVLVGTVYEIAVS